MAKFKKMKGNRQELKHWCDKYELTYKEFNCSNCKNTIKTDIMFEENGNCFGIKTSPCQFCGHHELKGMFHCSDEEFKKIYNSLVEVLDKNE